jgi:hypothetical protein
VEQNLRQRTINQLSESETGEVGNMSPGTSPQTVVPGILVLFKQA